MRQGAVAVLLLALVAVGVAGFYLVGSDSPGDDALVIYCAHDAIFAEEVLDRFEAETGIRVTPRFDTEATKSLGLTNLLIREKDNPRCDVFWNNQTLGTVSLLEHDLLLPYKGPGWERIPEGLKDPEGRWTGFAGRLRVWIVNTENMEATEEAIEERFAGDLSRMAIAKPLFGTTLSHYSILWQQWGESRLKEWHREAVDRGLKVTTGNATVKNLVAEGTCDFGWTDTDDYYVAVDDGYPVAQQPIRVAGKTICLPNSVAIIKGTEREEQAQRLVDWLLSEESEMRMAASKSRQIPLGPVDESKLSAEVRQLKEWSREAYDLTGLGAARGECLEWLQAEFLE